MQVGFTRAASFARRSLAAGACALWCTAALGQERGRLILLRSAGDAAESAIELVGDRPLSFTTLKLRAPPRVVVDLAETDLALEVRDLPVDDGTIRRVAAAPAGRKTARVVIELAAEGEFAVRAYGSIIEVRVPRAGLLAKAQPPAARPGSEAGPAAPGDGNHAGPRAGPPQNAPSESAAAAGSRAAATGAGPADDRPGAPPAAGPRESSAAAGADSSAAGADSSAASHPGATVPGADSPAARADSSAASHLDTSRADTAADARSADARSADARSADARSVGAAAGSGPPDQGAEAAHGPTEVPAAGASAAGTEDGRPSGRAAAERAGTQAESDKRASLPRVALTGPAQPAASGQLATASKGHRSAAQSAASPHASITGIGFRPIGDGEVVVRSDRALEVTASADGDALVLHLSSAVIPLPNNRRPLDTRFFNGPVERVVPLVVASGTDLRIELRARAEYQLAQSKGVLTVTFSVPR